MDSREKKNNKMMFIHIEQLNPSNHFNIQKIFFLHFRYEANLAVVILYEFGIMVLFLSFF